jgi:hypothetical protein
VIGSWDMIRREWHVGCFSRGAVCNDGIDVIARNFANESITRRGPSFMWRFSTEVQPLTLSPSPQGSLHVQGLALLGILNLYVLWAGKWNDKRHSS